MNNTSRRISEENLAGHLNSLGGPAYADRTKCDDAIDPISQQRIWDLADDGKSRIANYAEIGYLFSYVEHSSSPGGRAFVRGFAIESFQQLLLQARKYFQYPNSESCLPSKVRDAIDRNESNRCTGDTVHSGGFLDSNPYD